MIERAFTMRFGLRFVMMARFFVFIIESPDPSDLYDARGEGRVLYENVILGRHRSRVSDRRKPRTISPCVERTRGANT